MEISHAAFEALPSDRAHNYLRDLLAAVGVLPPYEPAIARMTPWLEAKLEGLPADEARVVNQFARWRVLRRLRGRAERSPPCGVPPVEAPSSSCDAVENSGRDMRIAGVEA